MEYIKEYTEYAKDTLEDYLLEILDRNGIGNTQHGESVYYKYYSLEEIKRSGYQLIKIYNIPYTSLHKILKDIDTYKPTLEKRIGCEVFVSLDNMGGKYYISIKAEFKYIKENNEMDKIEELSEYLQELFDKCKITHTEEHDPTRNTWALSYFGRIGKVGKKVAPMIQIDFSQEDLEDNIQAWYNFLDNFDEARPLLEKRIGCQIKISRYPNRRIVIQL